MDGARLMNAAVASGHAAADFGTLVDSVWIDFTKGLGAPVGAVLAGSADFIARAWVFKQRLGGAMRQSGVLAAMCNYALDHNVARLDDDHEMATRIAAHLVGLPGVASLLPPETNIVIFDLADEAPDADGLVAGMEARGIRIGALGPRRIRVVTHMDVGAADETALLAAFDALLG